MNKLHNLGKILHWLETVQPTETNVCIIKSIYEHSKFMATSMNMNDPTIYDGMLCMGIKNKIVPLLPEWLEHITFDLVGEVYMKPIFSFTSKGVFDFEENDKLIVEFRSMSKKEFYDRTYRNRHKMEQLKGYYVMLQTIYNMLFSVGKLFNMMSIMKDLFSEPVRTVVPQGKLEEHIRKYYLTKVKVPTLLYYGGDTVAFTGESGQDYISYNNLTQKLTHYELQGDFLKGFIDVMDDRFTSGIKSVCDSILTGHKLHYYHGVKFISDGTNVELVKEIVEPETNKFIKNSLLTTIPLGSDFEQQVTDYMYSGVWLNWEDK